MQYGRDAHAEDILKDALKQNPDRHPVRLKLMELYASKQNTAALQEQYQIMTELTKSSGGDWIAAKQIMSAAQPADSSMGGASDRSGSISALLKSSDASGATLPRINLSDPTMIGDVPNMNQTLIKPAFDTVLNPVNVGMPINLATTMIKPTQPVVTAPTDSLDFEMDSPTLFAAPIPSPIAAPAPVTQAMPTAQAAKPMSSILDFDVSKFDLNPPSIFDKVSGDAPSSSVQAIETKFSLAQAYMDIGDKEGAKELLQEVMESGHQNLTEQAKALLLKI
jgi:pilus assembly protein FimV